MKLHIKVVIILVMLVFVGETSVAQQLPRYSAYMFDKAIINPAYAGTIPYINGTVAYRKQFMGIDGAPTTQFLSFHAPIQKKNIGLGLKIVNDQAAVIKNFSAEGMFSYALGLGSGKLSAGIETGIINQSTDFTNLIRHDATDNVLTNDKQTKTTFDLSFGLFYQTKTFFMGWSSYQLTKSEINYTGASRSMIARLWNHNIGIIGYNFGNEEKLRFEPSILIKQVANVPLQFDVNFRGTYKQLVSLGVSYRNSESIVFMTDVIINDSFKVGYAFDYTISGLADYQSGGHEVMFTYRKKLLPPARDKETHPRFYIY